MEKSEIKFILVLVAIMVIITMEFTSNGTPQYGTDYAGQAARVIKSTDAIAPIVACTDSDGINYYKYGVVSVGQNKYKDSCEFFEKSYYAESVCGVDEVAIGGMGGCNEMGPGYARPSMTTWSNAGAMYNGVAHDWQVGCKGQGAAVVEAICVKKTDLQYRLSSIGQTQHYINDEETYFAESLCEDNEVAIGGMGGCNEMGPGYARPSMTISNWVQRQSNEAKGWAIGCKGQGSAIVQAMCVDKTLLQYRISSLGQTQHYINDEETYFAESLCEDNEVAIGGMGGCNEMGPGYARPSMTISNWVQRQSNEAKGWAIGCKGQGTVVVEAICVDKTNLQYRIGALGQMQHYTGDGLVNEGVCNNNQYLNKRYVCPNGCTGGACITSLGTAK